MRRSLFFSTVIAALMLLFLQSPASATTFTDGCVKCHEPTVNSFVYVAPLSRTTECYTCHSLGNHSGTTVLVPNSGYFKTANSYASSPDILHAKHSGLNMSAISNGCKECHQTVSCTACHNNISHGEHSLTGGSIPPFTPPVFPQANGTTYTDTQMSCALAECHKQMPTVVKTNQDGTQLCVNCHSSGGHNHNVSATGFDPNPGVNCNSCHATNPDKLTAELATIHQQAGIPGYSCATCHNPTFVGSVIGDGLLDMKRNGQTIYCSSCHDGVKAHAVNHQPDHLSTGDELVTCNVCHDGVKVKGLFNAPTGTSTDVSKSTLHPTCNKCHASTNPTVISFIDLNKGVVNTTPYLCSNCHDAITPKHNTLHTVTTYLTTGDGDCAGCHSKNVTTAHEKATAKCDVCHGANPLLSNTKTVILNNLSSNLTRTGFTCQSCHTNAGSHAQQHPLPVAADGKTPIFATTQVINCIECHKTNLADEHLTKADATGKAYTCGTCHDTTSRVYSQVEGFKTSGTKAKCDDCHQIHGDLTTKHQSTADLSSTTFIVNCSWCHSSTNATYPLNNLIGIHVYPNITLSKTYTCDTCHAPSSPVYQQVKAGKTGCADCHNGTLVPAQHPDNQYYPRHVANSFPTFMPEYQPNCATCHKDNSIITLHSAQNVGCNSCHSTEAYKPAVVSLKVDCTGCHKISIRADMDMTNTHKPFHNADTVKYPATVECLNCHAKDTTVEGRSLLGVHKKDPNSPITCDTCHGTTARQQVKDAITANNVSCQACHPMGSAGHTHPVAPTGYDLNPTVACNKCHATNADGSAELATIHDQAAKAGKIVNYSCNTCHNPTFEGTGKVIVKDGSIDMKQNAQTVIYCTTCHNGTLTDALETKYKAHNGTHINSTGYGTYKGIYGGKAFDDSAVDCSKCHTSLDTSVVHDSKVHANVTCNSCHNSTNTAVQKVITDNWSRSATKVPYTCSTCHNTLPYLHKYEHVASSPIQVTLDCSSCHGAAAWTGTTAKIVEVHKNNCNTCHSSSNTIVMTFISSKKGIANPVYNCDGCHIAGGAQPMDTTHKPEHLAKHNAGAMDCSSCHGFSLASGTATDIKSLTIHPGGCNTCHGSATRNDVKLFITSRLGKVNTTYSCEDCHGLDLHLAWETKHLATLPTSDPNMVCANCHSNNLPVEHEKALNSTPTTNTNIGYKVFRSTSSTGTFTEIGNTTATTFANSGLAANTSYYYKVQAYDGKPNLSGFSNTISVTTKANTTTAVTTNPDLAQYASGNNGDSSTDPSSTTNYLSQLTDTSTRTYATVRENGSSDQYIFVKKNLDASNYSKVQLKLTVRNTSGTSSLAIYPYSNDTTINTTAKITGVSRSTSTKFTTETIDVTTAAKTMNGLGWMKFRIKPNTTATAYIAKVELVLTQAATSGGTPTNPPGTLPASTSDTTAPTAPTNLTGVGNYYDRIDLSWTASTDTGASTGTSTCSVCHNSTVAQNVKDAITNNNTNCSACHTIHGNIDSAHTAPGFGFITYNWDCSKCHTTALHTEHADRGLNCDTCHKSTKTKVTAAINSTATDGSNKKCDVCHTGTTDGAGAIHTDVTAPHLSGIFPTATDATCLGCHNTEKAEFVSTAGALHLVQISGITSKASGKGSYLSPWTYTSTVGCQGCHGASTAGGTTAYANILKKPYTYTSNSSQTDMLCFMCHNRSSYGSGSGSSGFSDGSNLHNIGDHENSRLQCSWCHAAKPHSTAKAHLIAIKGEPNSQGNVLTSYSHPTSGNYSVSSCGSNVSACDEH